MNFFLNSIYDITLPSLFIDQRGSLFVSKHWADLRHLPHKSSQVVRIGCIPSFSVIAVAYCIHYLRVLAEHPPPFCAGFPSCGLDQHRVPVHLFLWRITLFVHPLYMSSVWCLQKCSRVLTGWQMRNFTVIPLEKGGHSSVRRLLYSDDTLLSPQALQSKVHSGNVPCVSANIMLYSLTLPFHHALSSLMSHCIL